MKRFREQRGFTLIELAIVMVIIGIILGAVLKGQDLISNARTKKFINEAGREWETASWTYFDRKGKFPGDTDSDGIIGEGGSGTDDPLADINAASFINPPSSTVTLGSFTFYVFLGSDSTGTPANAKNVLTICRAADCATAFTADEIAYVESFDTAIDGVADGTTGIVRAVTAAPSVVSAAEALATYAAAGTTNQGAWTANTSVALLFYFDRAP